MKTGNEGESDQTKALLVMALPQESDGLFERQNLSPLYTGIGKINAAMRLTEALARAEKKPKLVINLGTAGSQIFPTHSLVLCKAFVQRDMDLTPLGMPLGETPLDPIPARIEAKIPEIAWPKGIFTGVCGTADVFESGKPKLECDLVDMEAYALAKVCRHFGLPFLALKYITDGSDHQAHQDWRKNLKVAAKNYLSFGKSIFLQSRFGFRFECRTSWLVCQGHLRYDQLEPGHRFESAKGI